ncbi:MAG: hypothetical protein QM642_01965 [Edaphocola sp.]
MAIKIFTPANCADNNRGKPTVSFNFKSGYVFFNAAACERLGLKEGDTVVLVQEDKDEEWYIAANSVGFALNKKEKAKGLFFNNKALAGQIAGSVGYDGNSGKVSLGSEAVEIKDVGTCTPIIVAQLKVPKK